MNRVIIDVHGGLVQRMIADSPDVLVMVRDFDLDGVAVDTDPRLSKTVSGEYYDGYIADDETVVYDSGYIDREFTCYEQQQEEREKLMEDEEKGECDG